MRLREREPYTSMRISLVLVLLVVWLEHYSYGVKAVIETIPKQLELAKPNCSATCGSVVIPYPFGTTPGCFFSKDFFVPCNITNNGDTKAIIHGELNNFVVLNISLKRQELRVSHSVNKTCLETGRDEYYNYSPFSFVMLPNSFYFSSKRNKFTTVGCNTFGIIQNIDESVPAVRNDNTTLLQVPIMRTYGDGCVSSCTRGVKEVKNGTCDPLNGCCQRPLAIDGIQNYAASFARLLVKSKTSNTSTVFEPWDNFSCGYSFVTEEGFQLSSSDLIQSKDNTKEAPLVLDWAIRNYNNCVEARSNNRNDYACKASYSYCLNSTNGPGYICKCRKGYQGNPYLLHGCQDIDECANEELNPCIDSAKCINHNGGANCKCPENFIGDGKKTGTLCRRRQSNQQLKLLVVVFGICTGMFVLATICLWISLVIKRRRLIKLKRMFFEQNGGILLQQHLNLSHHRPSIEMMRIFSSNELIKATNNYDKNNIIGQGATGTVYKGVLRSNKTVAIKRSKACDRSQIGEFINEGIVLSQVNHRNVVKLLGCCLETEVPVLVYEFVTNGTLASLLHANRDQPLSITLSWQMRLKIAAEIAGALAYLHSQTGIPILHRDVKSSNILLDDNFTAKVADFGASRLVPLGQTQVITLLQGTIGYLDPEFLYSNQLTDKSDVFSFGVILAELLTGKKPLIFEEDRETAVNLAVYFVSRVEDECLHEILDDQLTVDDDVFEVLKEVAGVAMMCLRKKREERPAMKEVAAELEALSKM